MVFGQGYEPIFDILAKGRCYGPINRLMYTLQSHHQTPSVVQTRFYPAFADDGEIMYCTHLPLSLHPFVDASVVGKYTRRNFQTADAQPATLGLIYVNNRHWR